MARWHAGQRQGFILLAHYLLLTFLIAWSAAGLRRSTTENAASERFVDTSEAFELAEAGLDQASRWLRSQPGPPVGTQPFDPFNGAIAIPSGTVTVTIDPDDANPISYLDLYTVTAIGQVNGINITRQLTSLLQTVSFARYSYFSNFERQPSGTPIWFTSFDHLTGPVHSNDRFNIAGTPIFDGAMSSVASSVNYKNPPPPEGNNPAFNGGLTLNTTAVTLPLTATSLRTAAQGASGAWFEGNTVVVLQANGTMLVTNAAKGWVNQPQPLPANGALFVNGGNVTVSGTLDGQLTIGTSNDVLLSNNIMYKDDPKVTPSSNDLLGLVAEQNVVVSASAPADMTIQASVMALASSFTVENWWVGPPKGTLSVYGGIIQDRRGPVGTFNSATGLKQSGYSKDYQYDTRLSALAPPFYPTTGTYRTVAWMDGSN